MVPSTLASLRAPEAGDLAPGSHVLYRDRVAPGPGAAERAGLPADAIATAARVGRHGGLIIEIGPRPSDPEAVHITALLTVAQLAGMLYEEALEEVDGVSPPPALLACGDRRGRGELATWVQCKEEEARRVGVPRLAAQLASAGIHGDVETAADQLWTACGY
jgi:hypothetical protein